MRLKRLNFPVQFTLQKYETYYQVNKKSPHKNTTTPIFKFTKLRHTEFYKTEYHVFI